MPAGSEGLFVTPGMAGGSVLIWIPLQAGETLRPVRGPSPPQIALQTALSAAGPPGAAAANPRAG